jgi:hypothetical protein
MRALTVMIVGIIVLVGNQLIYASPLPANHTLTTKLTDTLKSITSNVSTSIVLWFPIKGSESRLLIFQQQKKKQY